MTVRAPDSRLKRLLDTLSPGPVLILMHDNPDPDCFASACGLKYLFEKCGGVRSTIAYGGVIGRASNKALIGKLGLELRHVDQVEFAQFPRVVLVDTQPRGGNNSLPHDRIPDAVLDHHGMRKATRAVPFADVRTQYGATCTMVVEYLTEAEIEIPQSLATLLFYAIRTETQELGREASKADVEAYMELFPIADLEVVSGIERARIPVDYFEVWYRGMGAAKLFGNVATCPLGAVHNPDMIPEIADMLLRLEDVHWTFVCGYYSGQVIFSLRTTEEGLNAGALALRIVGKRGTAGGHDTMAGGRVTVSGAGEAPGVMAEELIQRVLKVLEIKAIGKPLLPKR
ncbi:MAG: DHH family phosphoesterase [Planctomycetes bacterium]|nr:DHH family phosphoesterase [Planctomycetota bacterium]